MFHHPHHYGMWKSDRGQKRKKQGHKIVRFEIHIAINQIQRNQRSQPINNGMLKISYKRLKVHLSIEKL